MPRAIYIPASVHLWHDHALHQTGGAVGDLPFFISGQRGAGLGNIFRRLWTFVKPILFTAGKAAGKAIGQQALSTSGDVIKDVIKGKSITDAIQSRGKEALTVLADKGADYLQEKAGAMKGSGLGVSPLGTHGNVRLMRAHAARSRKSRKRPKKTKTQLGGGRKKAKRGRKKKRQHKRKGKRRRKPVQHLKDIFA